MPSKYAHLRSKIPEVPYDPGVWETAVREKMAEHVDRSLATLTDIYNKANEEEDAIKDKLKAIGIRVEAARRLIREQMDAQGAENISINGYTWTPKSEPYPVTEDGSKVVAYFLEHEPTMLTVHPSRLASIIKQEALDGELTIKSEQGIDENGQPIVLTQVYSKIPGVRVYLKPSARPCEVESMKHKGAAMSPKKEEIVVQQPAVVVPFDADLPAGDEAGMENITSQDVKLPFIAIAQKTSKCLDSSEGKYIAGITFGELYNSETREVYGKGPVQFLPVLMNKRACLKKENGTHGEQVDWDDPRVTWEGARAAHLDKPEGLRIYDWAIVLVPSMERAVLSFQSTSFGAGQSLNTILDKYRALARMTGKGFRPFTVRLAASVFIDKNETGSFGKFLIEATGSPTKDEYTFASNWFNSIKDKKIIVEDVTAEEHMDGEGDTSFDPQTMDVTDGHVEEDM